MLRDNLRSVSVGFWVWINYWIVCLTAVSIQIKLWYRVCDGLFDVTTVYHAEIVWPCIMKKIYCRQQWRRWIYSDEKSKYKNDKKHCTINRYAKYLRLFFKFKKRILLLWSFHHYYTISIWVLYTLEWGGAVSCMLCSFLIYTVPKMFLNVHTITELCWICFTTTLCYHIIT